MNEVKSVSISELARILNLSIESTALAVGWLVCENKVFIGSKNGQIEICSENTYNFCFG
ncbi:winged helix-turn-helix domain-containing protein [Phocaeicola dorei]|uniref:winged helix-turn-helix domain-containing protein n=1 Tax=Phocaeicola dorei TaxID=357276 RepID=UPI001F188EC1|nr:winged helix-turn-helix domain-containing protein [Phocaeicola dorei]